MSLVEVDQGMLDRLRALRLWHWQGVLYRRKQAEWYVKREQDGKCSHNQAAVAIEWANKQADFHLLQVQALNDFFPLGDTAENDEAKDEKG